jgi:hypothetical protein
MALGRFLAALGVCVHSLARFVQYMFGVKVVGGDVMYG